jgi:hypothetical protein
MEKLILAAMQTEPQFSSLDPVTQRALMSTMRLHTVQPKQSVHLHDQQRCADAQPHPSSHPYECVAEPIDKMK